MILLPLRGGSRGDQVENARALEKAGAALVFSGEGGGKALGELALSLAGDGEKRQAMAAAARGFAPLGSAEIIAGALVAAVQKEQTHAI
jgi:UDP-N-acetylglucosamine:LPS N-acetylglucosamine transferase